MLSETVKLEKYHFIHRRILTVIPDLVCALQAEQIRNKAVLYTSILVCTTQKSAGEITAVFINRQANLSLIYKVTDWLVVTNSINKARALLSLSIALKIKYKAILVVYGSGISF